MFAATYYDVRRLFTISGIYLSGGCGGETSDIAFRGRTIGDCIPAWFLFTFCIERPIFGQAMIDGPADLRYRLSAGTLYPILHGMEQQG
jgi:hypothetical protein